MFNKNWKFPIKRATPLHKFVQQKLKNFQTREQFNKRPTIVQKSTNIQYIIACNFGDLHDMPQNAANSDGGWLVVYCASLAAGFWLACVGGSRMVLEALELAAWFASNILAFFQAFFDLMIWFFKLLFPGTLGACIFHIST